MIFYTCRQVSQNLLTVKSLAESCQSSFEEGSLQSSQLVATESPRESPFVGMNVKKEESRERHPVNVEEGTAETIKGKARRFLSKLVTKGMMLKLTAFTMLASFGVLLLRNSVTYR